MAVRTIGLFCRCWCSSDGLRRKSSGARELKFQTPTSKLQRNTKLQVPTCAMCGLAWRLKFGAWCSFLLFQNLPQRVQNRFHIFLFGRFAHESDAPDFALDRKSVV